MFCYLFSFCSLLFGLLGSFACLLWLCYRFLVCLRVYKEKKKKSIFQMKTLLEVVLLLYCSGKLCYVAVIQFVIRDNDYDAELSGWWVVWQSVTLRYTFFRFFIAWAESEEITLLAFSVYDKKITFEAKREEGWY